MPPKTITFADKSYPIHALSMRQAKAWREKFAEPLIGIITQSTNLLSADLTTDAANIIGTLGKALTGAVDRIADAIFAYDVAIAADREWILDNATDEEAISAIITILGVVYPFGSILARLTPAHTAS